MKKFFSGLIFLISLLVIFIIGTNAWVVYSTEDRVVNDIRLVPETRVALVLGTSKQTIGGGENQYFTQRIQTAADLFKIGRVSHILVSGDNRSEYYNEPQDMYLALKDLGVPDSAITLDYAGLRTLDSVVRCIKIFGQRQFAIISQEFHGYRALFIADHYGADAVVYSAPDPDEISRKVSFREMIARPLAVIDLYILNKQPRFLGEKENL